MGILSRIKKIAKGVAASAKTLVSHPVKSFTTGAKAISAVTAAPVTTLTKGLRAGEAQVKRQGILTSSIKNVASVGAVAGVVVGGGALAGSATATRIVAGTAPVAIRAAKGLIPTTPKGRVIAGAATIVGAGAVINQPVKSTNALISAPGKLAQFGGNLADLAAEPSLENAKNIVKENPLLSAAAALAVGGTIVKTAAPLVSGLLTKNAIENQTEALLADNNTPYGTPAPAALTPVTPATQEISQSSTRRIRKRPQRAQKSSTISQKVQLMINNRQNSITTQNRRYINNDILN